MDRIFPSSEREQAESIAAIDSWKQGLPILEIIQRSELPLSHDMFEVLPGGIVCGNSSGYNEAGAALWTDQLEASLREHRIGVYVSQTRKRKAASLADELAFCFRLSLRVLEIPMQCLFRCRGIGAIQVANEPVACGLVACGSNLWRA